MQTDVLLQHQGIRVFLMAHRTLVEVSHGGTNFMHCHVGFKVALCREGPTANSALKWSFTGMRPIVHLQGTFAG